MIRGTRSSLYIYIHTYTEEPFSTYRTAITVATTLLRNLYTSVYVCVCRCVINDIAKSLCLDDVRLLVA